MELISYSAAQEHSAEDQRQFSLLTRLNKMQLTSSATSWKAVACMSVHVPSSLYFVFFHITASPFQAN